MAIRSSSPRRVIDTLTVPLTNRVVKVPPFRIGPSKGRFAVQLDERESFSPKVEVTAPDTVVLDIAPLRRLFGAPDKIAAACALLDDRARELLHRRVAVARGEATDDAEHAEHVLRYGVQQGRRHASLLHLVALVRLLSRELALR